jgi:L-lactate dehydrogenase complex protein LldG
LSRNSAPATPVRNEKADATMAEFDTSKARAAIFSRIRVNQKRGAAITADERAAVADYLQRHPSGPRPAIEGDLKLRFRAASERMSSTVEEVASWADAPAAVARYLAAQQLGARAVIWSSLAHLDWAAAGMAVAARPPQRDETNGADPVGITSCFCALAETGTLVLLSSPETPASTHLLPATHVALVPASRIVATMEDAFALLRAERGGVEAMMPRAINMVSGPSRTGDIEQTIVLGAHGPFRVHLVVITEA